MKTRKIGKRKIVGKCCEVTYKGLHKWYKSLFEKLGWMVLAKDHGMTDKLSVYVNSIYRIHMAIQQKMKITEEKDRLNDLQIMENDIRVLLAHVQKDFKI